MSYPPPLVCFPSLKQYLALSWGSGSFCPRSKWLLDSGRDLSLGHLTKLLSLLSSLVYFCQPEWCSLNELCISCVCFCLPLMMLFLDPCLLALAGITKILVPHPICLSKAIKSRLWEKDPLPGKPLLPELIAGISHSGPYLVHCQSVVVWVMWLPLSPVVFREICLERNVMGPTNKLSGVSKSWVEWPVKTGLCQKWWIVFVDFEQLSNRSATM